MTPDGAIRGPLAPTDELVPGEIALTPLEKEVLDGYKADYRLELLKRLRNGVLRITRSDSGRPVLADRLTRQQRRQRDRAEDNKQTRRSIAKASRRRNRR